MTEVVYSSFRSQIAPITVVEGPQGVLLVDLRERGVDWIRDEAARAFGTGVRLKRRVSDGARQIREYLEGRRRDFDVPIDLRLTSGFRNEALRALTGVRFGQVVSYGELARRAGRPGGARAVGGAMGHNPIPVIVPCHRVVAADGTLGGFTGGLDIKRRLHVLEGIAPRTGGWISSRG